MVKRKGKKSGRRSVISILTFILLVVILTISYKFYTVIFSPNILVNSEDKEMYFYVRTGWQSENVINSLSRSKLVKNKNSFAWLARQLDYEHHIHPGRYMIQRDMSNFALLRMLRSGTGNIPVQLVINEFKTKEQLAGYVGAHLEIDSLELINKLRQPEILKSRHLNHNNVIALFIPETYEFYWNVSQDKFFERILKKYDNFWDEERRQKAISLNLKPSEVSTLASIIQEETNHRDEMSTIAGVYLNRLRKDMKLQSDPTVKFIINNRQVHRIYGNDLSIESPYNTYKYKGLPPGPICMPQPTTIDAVLNAEKHDYVYFCARADNSGEHVFSKTYEQHLKNAKEYQKMLNKNNIR